MVIPRELIQGPHGRVLHFGHGMFREGANHVDRPLSLQIPQGFQHRIVGLHQVGLARRNHRRRHAAIQQGQQTGNSAIVR